MTSPCASHPELVSSSALLLFDDDDLTCPICLELFSEPVTTPCGHTYCQLCWWQAQPLSGRCSRCNTPQAQRLLGVNIALRAMMGTKHRTGRTVVAGCEPDTAVTRSIDQDNNSMRGGTERPDLVREEELARQTLAEDAVLDDQSRSGSTTNVLPTVHSALASVISYVRDGCMQHMPCLFCQGSIVDAVYMPTD